MDLSVITARALALTCAVAPLVFLFACGGGDSAEQGSTASMGSTAASSGEGGGAPADCALEPPESLPQGAYPDNTWVRIAPTAGAKTPSYGWEGAAAYDITSRKWIHQGGHDGIPQGFHLFTFDLDAERWEQRFPDNSPEGVCVIDGSSAVDAANERFVRFPGGSLAHGYQYSRGEILKRSPVWLYDVAKNHWANMRPPPYEALPPYDAKNIGTGNGSVAYDDRDKLVFHFGGINAGGATSNLHLYDAWSNRFELVPAESPPPVRDGSAVGFDAASGAIIVFGGQYLEDPVTWVFHLETSAWEGKMLDPHPPIAKSGDYSTIPKMACDTRRRRCLLASWDPATGSIETWALDTAALAWSKLSPPASPSASLSRSRNLSFAEDRNVFLLELQTKDYQNELWAFRLAEPGDAAPLPAPSRVAVETSEDSASLSWPAAPGAVGYAVYRAEADHVERASFEKLGETVCPLYEDLHLKPARYVYEIRSLGPSGEESTLGARGRAEPRALLEPVVSVLAKDHVRVRWDAHPSPDVAGYNVYRGLVTVRTVTKGKQAPWTDNDPDYGKPLVAQVLSITEPARLNDALLSSTSLDDPSLDLTNKGPESADYPFAVYAYVVRAVNRLGVESGPSPYAMTIPSEPRKVLLREQGSGAEITWESLEEGLSGHKLYRLGAEFEILPVTDAAMKEGGVMVSGLSGKTRFWVSAVDAIGQEGQPSSPAWFGQTYAGFFEGEWHQ